MLELLYIILYLLCFSELIFFVFRNSKKGRISAAYNGVSFAIFIFYILIPILCILFKNDLLLFEKNSVIYKFYSHFTVYDYIIGVSPYKVILSILLVMMFIFFFNLFYGTYYTPKKGKEKKKISNEVLLPILVYFTFAVGSISLFLLIDSMGGLSMALANAEYYRSFYNELSSSIGWKSIFLISSRFITVTPFLCWYLINGPYTKKTSYRYIFVISIALSVIYFLFNAGRTPLLLFIICFFYAFLKKKHNIKHLWFKLIICGILALPLLDVLDWLFVYLKTGEKFNVAIDYIKYLYEIMPPYRNLLNVTDIVASYGLMFGKDFIYAFVDIIPGISVTPSYVNTSLYINGTKWKIIGGIPNDLITFSYLQLGALGVGIVASFLGRMLKVIDSKLETLKNINGKNLFSAILTTNLFAIVLTADFITIIKSQFLLIIVLILLFNANEDDKNE